MQFALGRLVSVPPSTWVDDAGCSLTFNPSGYLSGGGGVILSRTALEALRPVVEAATASVGKDIANGTKTWSA